MYCPIRVFSANHLPLKPATGCHPISMGRDMDLISASSGGMTFGFGPRPAAFSSAALPLSASSLPLARLKSQPFLLIPINEC